MAATRRTRRARRGRPAKTDPPPPASGYRLAGEVEGLTNAAEEHGWVVLATTVRAETCTEAEILQAYQDQNTTVESGLRWSKNPAALSPVWLEKPARLAALAMRTVIGWLVSTVLQRQVRLSLRTHDQQIPGNKGMTATPTAAQSEPPENVRAAAHYQQALAEELSMRPLQAHCHRGLGTLYATSGQREQAYIALSTASEMYRGMEMTLWLPQTETALAQVEA